MSLRMRAVIRPFMAWWLSIPLHDQPPIPVDMDVARAVVTYPGHEHVPTPADLGHSQTLPHAVTVHNDP